MKLIFDAVEHEDIGEMGWKLRGSAEGFDPFIDGLGIAHDCLEEWRGGGDQIHDELMAFGVMIWIRGVTGFFDTHAFNTSPVYHISSGWDDLAHHVIEGYEVVAPDEWNANTPLKDPETEKLVQEIAKEGRKSLCTEFYKDDIRTYGREWRKMCRGAVGWMRAGVRRAMKRYGKYGNHRMLGLFYNIQSEVNRRGKNPDVGEVMEIQIIFRRGEVRLKRYYPTEVYA